MQGSSLAPPAAPPHQAIERTLIWFYVGAFLGPFGSTIVQVLLTTLAVDFGTDLGTVVATISVYMVAFAVCLLFSGAISDAIGARRAVTGGCAIFGVASLVCALAPTVEIFFVGRALQGVGNAFTTSLLMASLGDLIPTHRLGKALGFFAAFQMAGGLFGPTVSGVLALVNWRLTFVLVVVISAFLTVYYWRYFRRLGVGLAGRSGTNPARALAELWNARMGLLCLASFLGYLGAPSIGFLVAIYVEQRWGTSPAVSGLVLAGFGLVNVLAAPKAGSWVDHFGRGRMIAVAAGATIALMTGVAVIPSLLGFALLFALVGLPTIVTWTAIGTLAIEAFPRQRGAATSIFNAAKFAGFAAAPAVFYPIYHQMGSPAAFFLAGLATAGLIAPIYWYGRLTWRPEAAGKRP